MKQISLLPAVFLMCLFSCSTETIVCQDPQILVSCVGFTAADFSQGTILYRYKKDNAFDSLIDSTQAENHLVNSDTLFVTKEISGDYDYKLLLPATNAAYFIANINYEGNKTQRVPEDGGKAYSCFTHIASYTVNSTPYTRPGNNAVFFIDSLFVFK